MKPAPILAATVLISILPLTACGSTNNGNTSGASASSNSSTLQTPANQVSKQDVKDGIDKMLKLSRTIKSQLAKQDAQGFKESAAQVEAAWYRFENRVHVDYPLQYNEVEKYWMPLTAGAKSDHFDAKALSQLNDGMAKALTKLKQTVSGSKTSTGADSAQLQQAVDTYQKYVEQQVQQLVAHTEPFAQAVETGDLDQAKALYPKARVYYERIEPIAESFGDLDPRIDARENDVTGEAKWTGFHEIEKAIWVKHSLSGQAAYARQLVADEKDLQQKVKTVKLTPVQVIAGAVELLNEAATTKVTGEEERYSHIDLVDLSANVDGSKEAFEVVKPTLEKQDAALAKTIEQRFQQADALMATYRQGDGYKPYNDLTQADTRQISERINALAEPLSKAAKLLG
ncbi:iron uptake system protein EfeO [Alicyclobacillus shizuokensis]|uniref:iron uptake system protein EfeO n=1 Tax=Alicyclobacillus shizuokensis TaxID=392014 RepID=UPI00083482EB|nr:iron uptake system protein EfeO [Alicyclobacillus shizuokensis]